MDGVRPELIINADKYNIKVPNIRSFIKEGSYSKEGLYTVFPALTYVCHASLTTGTMPAKHGIVNNEIWSPKNEYKGCWEWFASDKVINLLSAAKKNRYISANVNLPGCIGSYTDYNIAEFWNNPYDEERAWLDHKFIRAMSDPVGIVEEFETLFGEYPGWERNSGSDEKRFKAGMWLLEKKIKNDMAERKSPFFMTQYFVSYDCCAHHDGVFSREALSNLEKIDFMIGELFKKADEIAGGNMIKCVVSDHGFIPIDTNICLNTLFRKEGLIKTDGEGNIREWEAVSQQGHGSAEIRLKRRDDEGLYKKVLKILLDAKRSQRSGIRNIYTRDELKKERTMPDADFAADAEAGFKFDNDAEGPLHKPSTVENDYWKTYRGTHGFHPSHIEMNSCFFIKGEGVPKKREIRGMKLIDVAPTLAGFMDITLPDADGEDIFSDLRRI